MVGMMIVVMTVVIMVMLVPIVEVVVMIMTVMAMVMISGDGVHGRVDDGIYGDVHYCVDGHNGDDGDGCCSDC